MVYRAGKNQAVRLRLSVWYDERRGAVWVVSHAKPERGYDEDMIVCRYVNDYEQRTGHAVSREGIWLPSSDAVAPFLHMIAASRIQRSTSGAPTTI